jgi:hypothetical protein
VGIAVANPLTTSDANSQWNDRNTVTFSCSDSNIGYYCNDLNYSLNAGGIVSVDINAGLGQIDLPIWLAESYTVVQAMAFNSSNNLIYTAHAGNLFGSFNRDTNEWINLSDTDVADWVKATDNYQAVVYNSVDGNIYLGLTNGLFGRYSPTTNLLTNLSATDTGGWANTQSFASLAVDSSGNVYTGQINGLFGVYSPATNVWSNLSATDAGNWVGTQAVNSLAVDVDGNVYTGIGSGLFGVYSAGTWYNLSTTDAGNWAGGQSVTSVTIASDGNVYTGLNGGLFGVYIPDTNVWTSLSTTDAGNWAGAQQVNVLAYDSINDFIYTGSNSGLFGVYKPSTNVWTNLSSYDSGNWAGSTILKSLVFDSNRSLIYTGNISSYFGLYNSDSNIYATSWIKSITGDTGSWASTVPISGITSDGNFLYVGYGSYGGFVEYEISTGVWTDLSSSDSGNWASSGILDVKYNSTNSKVYTGLTGGLFGYLEYVIGVPSWVNLSSTDSGNWVAGYAVTSLSIDVDGNVYTGLANGLFGVYNPVSNVWTNLSATDASNWAGTQSSTAISVGLDNNVYTLMSGGLFGAYNPSTNVWTDLSATDTGNWATNKNGQGIAVSSDGNVYTGSDSGQFGVYTPSTNVWTNLSATDTGNWAGTSVPVSRLSYDSVNNLILTMCVQNNSFIGIYSPSTNVWTSVATKIGYPDVWNIRNGSYSFYNLADKKTYVGFLGQFGVYDPIAKFSLVVPDGNNSIAFQSKSRNGVTPYGSFEDVQTAFHALGTGSVNQYVINIGVAQSSLVESDPSMYALSFTMDCNDNTYDLDGNAYELTPVNFNEGSYSCTFTAPDYNNQPCADNSQTCGHYDSNTIEIVADGTKAVYVYMTWSEMVQNNVSVGTRSGLSISNVQFDCNDDDFDLTNQASSFYTIYTHRYSPAISCDIAVDGFELYNTTVIFSELSNYTYVEDLIPSITFSNLAVYQDGNYTAPVNLFNQSDIVIRWGFTATGIDVNTLSAHVFYTTPFDTNNCYGFIRDEKQCGYKEERNIFSVVSQVGDAYTFRSSAEDDHAFKTWFYNGDPDLYETVTQGVTKSDFNITKSDTFVKTLLSSVIVDKNISYNLSIDARYTGTGTRTLSIYDCNTDLGVLTPVNNRNCWLDTITTATTKSPDGFYSILHTSNDLNMINNVKLNVNGNHYIYYTCSGCTPSKYWSIGLIDMNTNIDKTRNWTSTNGIDSFVANAKTVDAHYHALNLTIPNVFRSYFTIDNNFYSNDTTTTFTSDFYDDSISSANTIPHIDAFVSPTTGLYSGVVDVNIEVRDSELNEVVCDFNLVDSSLAFVAEIESSVSPVGSYCTSTFDSASYTDGNYFVLGRVRETATPELLSASEYSREFEIRNAAPPVNVYNLTFNVKDSVLDTDLSSVGMDCNVNAYDLTNQSSPFSLDFNEGSYLCNFSKTGYDSNNSFSVIADANNSYTIYLTETPANSAPVIGIILFCDGTCSSTKSVDPATDLTISVEITDPNGQSDVDATTLALIISSNPSNWDRIIASPVSHGTRDGCVEDGNIYCLQVDSTDWTTKFVAGVTSVKIDVSDTSAEPATQVESSGLTINATVGIVNNATSGSYTGLPAVPYNTVAILTNESNPYITTTHNGNVNINVKITATALSDSVHTDIPISAHYWSLTSDSRDASQFTGNADSIKSNWERGSDPISSTADVYMWLNIPASQPAGVYTGTLTYSSEAA